MYLCHRYIASFLKARYGSPCYYDIFFIRAKKEGNFGSVSVLGSAGHVTGHMTE